MGAINFFSINGAGGGGGGSTVNTLNGVTGDGSVATPVELGGKPLAHQTTIDANGNDFHLSQLNGDNTEVSMDLTGAEKIGFNGIGIVAGPGQATGYVGVKLDDPDLTGLAVAELSALESTNVAKAMVRAYAQNPVVIAEMATYDIGSGYNKYIRIRETSGSTGIEVLDNIDGIGLIGKVVFSQSDPKQYVQFGNIPGGIVASKNVPGQNATDSLFYSVGSSYEYVRVSVWALYRTGTGSVQPSITYVDNNGNTQTINFGAINSVTMNNDVSPLDIQVQASSNVEIDWTVTGTIVFDEIATIEKLL